MSAGLIAGAVGLFTITNFDDIVILALYFGQDAGQHGATRRVVIGQYLAFTAILAISVAIAYGASFLPKQAIAYLGLIPITLGLWDAGRCGTTTGAATTASTLKPHQAGRRSSRSPQPPSATAATTSASTCQSSPPSAPTRRSFTP